MGQVQRHGDMAQTAVHPHDTGTSGQRIGQGVQGEPGPDNGAGQALGDLLRCFLLRVTAVRQGHGVATGIKTLPQTAPVLKRPLLVGARGAMHQRHPAVRTSRLKCYVYSSCLPSVDGG